MASLKYSKLYSCDLDPTDSSTEYDDDDDDEEQDVLDRDDDLPWMESEYVLECHHDEPTAWAVYEVKRTCGINMRLLHCYFMALLAATVCLAILGKIAITPSHYKKNHHKGEPQIASDPHNIALPALVYILRDGPGMASALLDMFTTAAWMKQTQNRNLLVAENFYHDHQPEQQGNKTTTTTTTTQGLLTGWFTPNFPVIDTRPEFDDIVLPLVTNPQGTGLNNGVYTRNRGPPSCADWNQKDTDSVAFACNHDYRDDVLKYFNTENVSDALYEPLVEIMCPNMQLNGQALAAVEQFGKDFDVPAFDENAGTTVAFHVSRGDKLLNSDASGVYTGEEYVARLVQVIPRKTTINHCLVVTDNADAIDEIQTALKKNHFHCQLHSFTKNDDSSTLELVAEMSYLINATYFVGNFNSNVDVMASVLRSCDGRKPRDNYSNSFDVEGSNWYLR